MNRVYAYLTEKNDGVAVSAVISMGDSLNNGHEKEGVELAKRFNGIKASYLEKYGTELAIYALMGNHEYNNGYFYSTSPNSEAFIRVPREEGMSDSEINAALGYLDGELSKIVNRFKSYINPRKTI